MADTTEQAVWQALRNVIEPDLGENIVDLGLVVAVRASSQGDVRIDITMTTRYSPHADVIVEAVKRAAQRAGAGRVEVRQVYQPAWTPYHMAEPLRALLGLPDREPAAPGQAAETRSWRSRLRRRLRG